jgi:inosine-uridine nucleoside N-ribohydrolase
MLRPNNPVSEYVSNSAKTLTPPPLCDEVLAAILLDPLVVARTRSEKLSVETDRGPRFGAVNVLDENADRRPVHVIEKIDEVAFWRIARRTLADVGR